eukprot:11768636-Heterocapsa_arctica.AAC.1
MELGFPTDEETAHTPLVDEGMAYDPGDTSTILADFYCGNLWECDIDASARESVMAEMCVTNDGEIWITQWYRDAVELGRFYPGGESDDMT